jgi:hypothetical protein
LSLSNPRQQLQQGQAAKQQQQQAWRHLQQGEQLQQQVM